MMYAIKWRKANVQAAIRLRGRWAVSGEERQRGQSLSWVARSGRWRPSRRDEQARTRGRRDTHAAGRRSRLGRLALAPAVRTDAAEGGAWLPADTRSAP